MFSKYTNVDVASLRRWRVDGWDLGGGMSISPMA